MRDTVSAPLTAREIRFIASNWYLSDAKFEKALAEFREADPRNERPPPQEVDFKTNITPPGAPKAGAWSKPINEGHSRHEMGDSPVKGQMVDWREEDER